MTDLKTTAAEQLSTRAAKRLAAMRVAITRADAARSDAAHPGAGHQGRRHRHDHRRRPPRRGRGLGRAGDPRGNPGERLPARGSVGRPHPAPLGALGGGDVP